MIEVLPPCPKHPESPCCWHINVQRISAGRETAHQGSDEICCWCAAKRPLVAYYRPPKAHGPHCSECDRERGKW